MKEAQKIKLLAFAVFGVVAFLVYKHYEQKKAETKQAEAVVTKAVTETAPAEPLVKNNLTIKA